MPLLAAFQAEGGALRFAVLQSRLRVPRETTRRALRAGLGLGLLVRNPGYGHPLRPEYLLTARGGAVAPACTVLLERVEERGLEALAARKWPLPVLATLMAGAERFSEVEAALRAATPRAVSAALGELVEAGCVRRTLADGRPPGPRYGLTPTGQDLAQAAGRVAEAARGIGPG